MSRQRGARTERADVDTPERTLLLLMLRQKRTAGASRPAAARASSDRRLVTATVRSDVRNSLLHRSLGALLSEEVQRREA